MKSRIFTAFSVLAVVMSFSVASEAKKWERVYASDGYGTDSFGWVESIIETVDGNYIFTGSLTSDRESNFFLIQIDEQGSLLWHKNISEHYGIGRTVIQADNGDFVVVGSSDGGSTGRITPFLIWTNSNGDRKREIFYSTHTRNGTANSICQLRDGSFMVVGTMAQSSNEGDYDILLMKINNNGSLVWQKGYGEVDRSEFGYGILEASDGNIVVLGSCVDFYLMKVDPDGNIIWSKVYGGPHSDTPHSFQETSDGGFILVGNMPYAVVDRRKDVYLVKTDSEGNELWSKTFGGVQADNGFSVVQTPDGGFAIAGSTEFYSGGVFTNREVAFLIKTDSEGNELWTKYFGGEFRDRLNSVVVTRDGGLVAAGSCDFYQVNDGNLYVIKTDENGNVPPHFIRGDTNLDSKIDIADGIYLLNYIFQHYQCKNIDAMDVDDDGDVDIADGISLLTYLLKDGRRPKRPFPLARFDATLDQLSCN